MGFSRSSSDGRYQKGTHGSGHYQQKGLLGNLMNFMGSGSGSEGRRHRQERQGSYYDQPVPGQYQADKSQDSLTCGKCQAKIPVGSKFCLQCGEKVADALFCPNCGEKLPLGAKFCSKCGSKLNG